jgi:hypothetical protein
MCVGKFQRTSVKNHFPLYGATSSLVILASLRKEFATARAGAVIFFLHFLFSQKESGNQINERLDPVRSLSLVGCNISSSKSVL